MKWTTKEDNLIKLHYSTMDKINLLSILPNRSWDAIQLRGRRIFNLSRISFLKQYGNNHAKGFKHVFKPKKKKDNCQYISARGYKYIKVKEFDETLNGWEGYRPEHIVCIEKFLGRKLKRDKNGKGEGTHHIDGIKLNNDIDNLLLYKNEKEHRQIHSQLQKLAFELVQKKIIKFNKITKEYYYE